MSTLALYRAAIQALRSQEAVGDHSSIRSLLPPLE